MRNTLIVTHAALPHAVEKFAGVYSYAKGMGWRCSIVETASLGRGLNAAIAPYHPDGIIHEGPLYEAGRLRAAFGACPTVWLDPGKVLPFMKWRVASDPDAIARIAFDELRRGGCGDFVFVTMFPGAEWSRSRRMHFLRHAAADGLRAKTVTLAEDGGAAGGRGGRLSSAFAAMSRPVGVFAVKVCVGKEIYDGFCNIGFRPTVNPLSGKLPLVEVHIFNFNKNIYGHNVTIWFIRKLRDEMKFGSLPLLVDQLKQDRRQASQILRRCKFDPLKKGLP